MQELLKAIRQIEIKTRKLVETTFSGQYHSAFKGQGISFAEVRPYQVGDDVRRIDWRVTARTGDTYVKEFEEERELTVIIALDISRSGRYSSGEQSKRQLALECAAVLGFSAIHNQDKVGLLLFSDHVERFIPPKKGRSHMMRVLRDMASHESTATDTNIGMALDHLLHMQKKRALVFLISDMIDEGYERSLRLVAKKHELIPIVVSDPAETTWPNCGKIRLQDSETGEQIVVDTNDSDTRDRFQNMIYAKTLSDDRLYRSVGVTPIKLTVGRPFISALQGYFYTKGQLR